MVRVSDERNGWDAERVTCRPCRGTGRVLSTLGGAEHELRCPWCAGTGEYPAGRDAQQAPAERSPTTEHQ